MAEVRPVFVRRRDIRRFARRIIRDVVRPTFRVIRDALPGLGTWAAVLDWLQSNPVVLVDPEDDREMDGPRIDPETIAQHFEAVDDNQAEALAASLAGLVDEPAIEEEQAERDAVVGAAVGAALTAIAGLPGFGAETLGRRVREAGEDAARPFDRLALNGMVRRAEQSTGNVAGNTASDHTTTFFGERMRDRQMALGVEQYVWTTVGDDRVRESHMALDGTVQRWDSPVPGEGLPGEPPNCRCAAVPILPEVAE